MLKEYLFRFLLLVSVTIISLFFGELLIRIVTKKEIAGIHEYSPQLGWVKKSNLDGYVIRPEFEVLFQTNSKGIRGPEYSYEKKGFRIMVLGDSFSEGYFINREEMFSTLLENQLIDKLQVPVEVINTGTSYYGTDQELLYFMNEGKRYHPDITILMFYGNDIFDIMENHHGLLGQFKPYFTLSNDTLRLQVKEVINNPEWRFKAYGYADEIKIYEEELYVGKVSVFLKIKTWLTFNSKLYKLVSANTLIHSLGESIGITKSDIPLAVGNGAVLVPPDENDLTENFDLFEKLLIGLNLEVKRIGSELVIFCIPRQVEFDQKRLNEFIEFHDMPEDYKSNLIANRVEEIARIHNINCVNATDAFAVKTLLFSGSNKRLFYEADHHWNATGNELAASLLFEEIIKLQLNP